MKKLHALMFALGLGLLIYLVLQIGIQELGTELASFGWGLIPLIIGEGLAELFHAISLRYCLSGPQRSISMPRLFGINMAGYAISYILPVASLSGDVMKAGLLALHGKGPRAVSAVLVSKLSFALAHLCFVVLGAVFILPRITLPRALRTPVLIGSIFVAFGIMAFFWMQKRGKLGAFARSLAARRIGGKTMQRAAGQISNIDEALKLFYRERPWGLTLAVFWHLLGYAVGIFQIWYFCHLLAADSGFPSATKVWFVGMWFDLMAFAVPTNVGILEGSRMMAFKSVGYEPLLGVTYAVALRVAQLFWTAFALAGYAFLLSPKAARPKCDNVSANPKPKLRIALWSN